MFAWTFDSPAPHYYKHGAQEQQTFHIHADITLSDVVFSIDAGSQMKAPFQGNYVACVDL